MKYFTKIAGSEQISYEVKGKKVYRTIEATQPFEGAKQPDPEAKFFTKTTEIKDLAQKEAIRKQLKLMDMAKNKRILE